MPIHKTTLDSLWTEVRDQCDVEVSYDYVDLRANTQKAAKLLWFILHTAEVNFEHESRVYSTNERIPTYACNFYLHQPLFVKSATRMYIDLVHIGLEMEKQLIDYE